MTRHVPISEFKDHASELVAAAENGEEIVITRHGKPAAKLSGTSNCQDDIRRKAREAMARLADIRAQQRAHGITTTVEEMISWKNEGQR